MLFFVIAIRVKSNSLKTIYSYIRINDPILHILPAYQKIVALTIQ